MAQPAEPDAHEQAKRKCSCAEDSESHGTKDIETISGMGTEGKGPVEADAHEQAKHKHSQAEGSEPHGTKDIESISGTGTEDEGHQPKKPCVTHGSGNSTANPAVESGSEVDYDALDAEIKG